MSTPIKRLKGRDDAHPDAVAFALTFPVGDLAGLGEQIRTEHGWRKDVGLAVEGDLAEASEAAPVTLWVLRPDADVHAVRRAVSAHQGVEAAPEDVTFARLRSKAAEGEDLTDEEMQTAVRLLLTRGT